MKKTTLRIVCAIIAIALMLGVLSPLLFMVFADDYNSADAAKAEMERLENELSNLQNTIDSLESNLQENEDTKAYYEQEANIISQQITVMVADIEFQEAALAQKQLEHEAKILEHKQTKDLFEERLSAVYKIRNNSAIEVLLGATTYSEASRYDENIQHISLSDTELMEKLTAEGIALQQQADEIATEVENLNNAKALLDQKVADYAVAIQNVDAEMTQQEADIALNETAYAELAEQHKAAEASWIEFITSGNNYDFEYGGGLFAWPLPGYYRISSDYNVVRYIYGVYDVHRGIDMPAPSTAVIYAAADGYVTTTGMHWSYGNAVKLDHGSGLISLYAHMSSVYVSNGQFVTMGTPIGTVGTTGNSTGNHLHFEVNLNGATVNPRNYLSAEDVAKLYY